MSTRTSFTTVYPESIALSTAFADAPAFIARHRLADDLPATAWDQPRLHLAGTARRLGVKTTSELAQSAARVLAAATGVENTSQFQAAVKAIELHQARNTLAAVLSAALQGRGVDPRSAVSSLPSLRPRPGGPARPLDDTEVLLMRLWSLGSSTQGPRQTTNAFRYAMVEGGAFPSEVTRLTAQHFDSIKRPSTVHLPGVYGVASSRSVAVPHWAQPIVAQTLAAHLGGPRSIHQPVAYAPRSHNASPYSAGASIARILHRGYKAAGIDGVTPEPLSALRWRVAHTLQSPGLKAAAALLGKAEDDPGIFHFARQPVPDTFKTSGGFGKKSYEPDAA